MKQCSCPLNVWARRARHPLWQIAWVAIVLSLTRVAVAETRVTSLVPGAAPTDTISSGLDFTCAITTDGHVACWGKNDIGQLGHDTSEPFNPTPTLVIGLDEVVSIAAGMAHACALRQSGQVWCWGDNGYGQLGDGTMTNRPAPVRVPNLNYFSFGHITAGAWHTCALTDYGAVFCWGDNTYGQLGIGAGIERLNVPSYGPNINAVNITSGSAAWHTCATLATGELKCWGANESGECGAGTASTAEYSPVTVQLPKSSVPYSNAPPRTIGVASLALAEFHTCISSDSGQVYCWGDNSGGKVTASDAAGPFLTPQLLTATYWRSINSGYVSVDNVKQVSVRHDSSCALAADGNVLC